MNFLAHLYLADDHPHALVGSILPDLARPRTLPAGLPAATLAAIAQHRAVDAFTDTHPIVARSKARLRAAHGRFTGILMDVFYDHILARDWRQWSRLPLAEFTARVYRHLAEHEPLMPQAMRLPVARMIEHDWLNSYASIEGIGLVLRRMSAHFSQRFERDINLEPATADLAQHSPALTADFNSFFPQLVRHAGAPVGEGRSHARAVTETRHQNVGL